MSLSRRHLLRPALGLPILAILPLRAHAEVLDIADASNKAGRQRMLSQRSAKFYLFRAAGLDSANSDQGLATARKEFETGLAEFKAALQDAAEIKGQLLTDSQWAFFANALNYYIPGAPNPVHQQYVIASSSEYVLEVMDTTTGLYQSLH